MNRIYLNPLLPFDQVLKMAVLDRVQEMKDKNIEPSYYIYTCIHKTWTQFLLKKISKFQQNFVFNLDGRRMSLFGIKMSECSIYDKL